MDWRTIKEFLKDSLKYIIIAAIVLLLVVYVVSLQQVIGPSMNPNYQEGDVLILNKLHYKLKKPKRFDVAVIKSKETKYFIKRVIGLPGEYIEYKDGILYVNGEIVEEKFNKIDGEEDKDRNFDLKEVLGYEVIPDGYYLVVGDNRGNSQDSRDPKIGLIPRKDFQGKVVMRIWPFR